MKRLREWLRLWRERRYQHDVHYIEMVLHEFGNEPMSAEEISFRASITLVRFWCIVGRLQEEGVLVRHPVWVTWKGRTACYYKLGPRSAWAVV